MSEPSPADKRSFVADSLAIGMLVMLAMTLVQRALGFVRGIWFCRLLDDAVLGQWSMAYDFVAMITPIMLLGLPGSLPRYVEHYRGRGQLHELVRRVLVATMLLGGLFCLWLMVLPEWFGWLVFSEPTNLSLVYSVGLCVVSFVAFSFVNQLVSALRQVRVVSLMQFVQSVVFTVIGVAWLGSGGGIAGLTIAFALATVVAMLPGLFSLRSGWHRLPRSDVEFDAGSMWRRLLPYAAALWAMNLLINLFFLADRYMILHLLPDGGQEAVGQYHSGRIIPALLMSLATMVGGVLMPYLTADWEGGNQERVRQRMQQVLFGIAATFTLGGAVALWIAPWMFAEWLQGRYSEGLELMPMAFVIAIWFSVATIGQEYLWVAERGKLVAVVVGIALLVNVGLNCLLLPMWGLHGAVVATLLANGVMLLGMWAAMARHGYPLDINAGFASLLPATLLAGPSVAILFVAIVSVASLAVRNWAREGMQVALRGRADRLAV